MAERVASLFAEIGVQDKATEILQNISNELMRTGTSAGIAAGAVIVGGIAIATALNDAKDAAQKYDQEVYQMSLATGQGAEATSRLIQVADDAGISYEKLQQAMKMAVKHGVEPNIQSLAALSDEYLKLAPGVDRGQFLLAKFGKSGMDMARFMDLGSAALMKMNGSIEKGYLVTDKAIQESEKYRKNIDNLTDAWDSFKVMVGNQVIPVLNGAMEGEMRYQAAQKQAAEELHTSNAMLIQQRAAQIMATQAKYEAIDVTNAHADALNNETSAVKSVADAQMSEADSLAIVQAAISGEYQNTVDDATSKLANLKDEQSNLNVELDNAVTKFGENSAQAGDYRDRIQQNVKAQQDLANATDRSIRSMIFQSVASKASASTQLELGRSLGLISEQDYAISSATQAIIDQGTPNYVDPNEVGQLKSLADNVLKMKGENIPITFDALISATIVDKDAVGQMIANQVAASIISKLSTNTVYGASNQLR